jgi:hypothetical protein
MQRTARPVLGALAEGRLKATMPVEERPGANRAGVTHLEALGRTLMGVAPWLELAPDDTPEGRERAEWGEMARRAVANAVDPASPDFLDFARGGQTLVDAAFLAQAVLRAPTALNAALDDATRARLTDALRATRAVRPPWNNWLLFAATVEAGLHALGAPDWDALRIDYAVRQHEQWYKGDGAYGDGPEFHWDYYNAFVIQPMLLDILLAPCGKPWEPFRERTLARARRWAEVQERLISPEGTFPPLGRSLAYRFGALQSLAQAALLGLLPGGVSPGQARAALTAVIRRQIEAHGTFDENGWLRIGFCGHQPGIGEGYISTGSLYLCCAVFLPLGLPPTAPFWSEPDAPWTARRLWSGEDPPAPDHAL